MKKESALCLSFAVLSGTAVFLVTNGCGNHNEVTQNAKITHVVIIFQENRTPDNLFHDPALIKAGADIASSGRNASGALIQLTPGPLATVYDLDHTHGGFEAMYNSGKMNGANLVSVSCHGTGCPPPSNPQFVYVSAEHVQPYFEMAEQYTFGDRMFQTNQGPSFPAHQFILSGTSAPTANSKLFMSENPNGILEPANNVGCSAPSAAWVNLVGPNGVESGTTYPCTEHPALTDSLDSKGLTWKYYAPNPGSIWTAPNAIEHICGPNAPPPNATACIGPDWVNHVVIYSKSNPAPILSDIANQQLPAMSWIIPSGGNSDHAGDVVNVGGPSWVAAIVNAIGNSPYWEHTAIIVTWDDWGGWFDHVPPPKVIDDGVSWGSGYVYGFRVPLIVISPYAKAHYISHVNHDFGSILKFVEEVYDLPSLGYADSHALDDLSDCFDFGQSPLAFKTISAPMNADHFLHDTTPPTDPDDD